MTPKIFRYAHIPEITSFPYRHTQTLLIRITPYRHNPHEGYADKDFLIFLIGMLSFDMTTLSNPVVPEHVIAWNCKTRSAHFNRCNNNVVLITWINDIVDASSLSQKLMFVQNLKLKLTKAWRHLEFEKLMTTMITVLLHNALSTWYVCEYMKLKRSIDAFQWCKMMLYRALIQISNSYRHNPLRLCR